MRMFGGAHARAGGSDSAACGHRGRVACDPAFHIYSATGGGYTSATYSSTLRSGNRREIAT